MHKLFIDRFTSELKLKYDERQNIFAGKVDGYSTILTQYQQSNTFYITFSVDKAPNLDSTEIKNIKKEVESISNINIEGKYVVVTAKPALKKETTIDNVIDAARYMVQLFKENGFVNCCAVSGQTENVNEYVMNGRYHILSEEVFIKESSNIKSTEEKEENFPAGAVGSFFGALIGMIVTILIARLGYVASLSGLILGVCTIKGYELLGKKISLKGILISLLFVVLATYAANHIDWSIEASKVYQIGIFDAIKGLPEALEFSNLGGLFMKDFLLMLVFGLLGFIPTAMSYFKYAKNQDVSYKI